MVNQPTVASLTISMAMAHRMLGRMAKMAMLTRMMVTSLALKEAATMIRNSAEDLTGVHMGAVIIEEIDVVVIDRIIIIIMASKRAAAMVAMFPAMMGVQMMVTNPVMMEPQLVMKTSNAEEHHIDVGLTDVVTTEEIDVATTTIGNRMSNRSKKRHNNQNDINMI